MTEINPTQATMLGLFGSEKLTGNDIMEIVDKTMSPYWSITRSQVYRELKVLAEMGLIEAVDTHIQFRNRQYYQITKEGKKAFRTWMSSPVESDSVRNNLALRIAFSDYLDDEQIVNLIEHGIEETKAELFRIQNMRTQADSVGLHWDSKAMRLSELHARATLRWLRELEAEFSQE